VLLAAAGEKKTPPGGGALAPGGTPGASPGGSPRASASRPRGAPNKPPQNRFVIASPPLGGDSAPMLSRPGSSGIVCTEPSANSARNESRFLVSSPATGSFALYGSSSGFVQGTARSSVASTIRIVLLVPSAKSLMLIVSRPGKATSLPTGAR